MKTPTQQQLATLLNLSRTTVSRSLSNHPAIQPETRRKVQVLARTLGYTAVSSRVIRKSRRRKPITIGVLVGLPPDGITLATYPDVLRGIQERAKVEHVGIEVMSLDPGRLSPSNLRKVVFTRIRDRGWRGLILIYPFAPEVVRRLAEKLSVVSVLTEYDHQLVDTVDTDHSDLGELVAELAAAGHERIGFATWDYEVGGRWTSRRFAAFAEGMYQQGLELNQAWTINCHRDAPRARTRDALADLVAQSIREDGVTAWVCAADHQAYGLMDDLRRRGLRAPDDFAITGFDGIDPPPGAPALTTLAVSHTDVGVSALMRLLDRILNPDSPRRKILVGTQLRRGATVKALSPIDGA